MRFFFFSLSERNRDRAQLLLHFPRVTMASARLELKLEVKLSPDHTCGWHEHSHLSDHHCLQESALAGSWSWEPNPSTLSDTGILTTWLNIHSLSLKFGWVMEASFHKEKSFHKPHVDSLIQSTLLLI